MKRAGGRPRRHGLDLDAAAMRRAVAGLVLLVVAACSAAAPSISESMAPADDASADAQAMSSPAEPSESSSVVITDGSPSLAAVASFQSSPTPAKAATPKPATPKPATPKPATPKPKPTPTASPWLGYCGDVRSPVQAGDQAHVGISCLPGGAVCKLTVKYPGGGRKSFANHKISSSRKWSWNWTVPSSTPAGMAKATTSCTYNHVTRSGPADFEITAAPTPTP